MQDYEFNDIIKVDFRLIVRYSSVSVRIVKEKEIKK